MDFRRNNLDQAASPYLRQHRENPVWWQEWNQSTLDYARENDRILLVSVGYSTCHWCHVMARGAFSDAECAAILNEHFVSIKVDREQRPDIDRYLMSFLVATTGSGGWPLNAFLTPDGRPFYAMTYASAEAGVRTPAFADILRQVAQFYRQRRDDLKPFELTAKYSAASDAARALAAGAGAGSTAGPILESFEPADESQIAEHATVLQKAFDRGFGGFGSSQKFPPHSTLLSMLYAASATGNETMLAMATETLDAMMTRGLHDHLQGGFFRYTVDRQWTIPHFEKMLYDQAMLLWAYSLAFGCTGRAGYRETAEGVLTSLEDTFRIGDLYAAGHDADTDHREGATYLWSLEEIEGILDETERDAFLRVFAVTKDGNFEGRSHLIRQLAPGYDHDAAVPAHRRPDRGALDSAVEKLLRTRRTRPQPSRDDKLITSWNALAACGLVAAHRHLGAERAFGRALGIARTLTGDFLVGGRLAHARIGDELQRDAFLSDHAALLLLLTFLGEETDEFTEQTEILRDAVLSFQRDGTWVESDTADFAAIPAEVFDQPVPSSVALAEMALLRTQIAAHDEYAARPFADPLGRGFLNITALQSRGYFAVVESPEPVPWDRLPPHSIQVRGGNRVTCHRGVCFPGLPPRNTGRKDA